MRGFSVFLGVVVVAIASACPATAGPSTEAVAAGLKSATTYLTSIATEGGYVWRYSRDLEEREGETPATATQIWVQTPGTPRIGEAFLAAWAATDDDLHLAAAAAAADALLRGQLTSGGWDYRIEFDPDERDGHGYLVDDDDTIRSSTFDDDTTQGALRFLMAFVDAAEDDWDEGDVEEVEDAVLFGLERMLESQYPNGAWPQRFVEELDEVGMDEHRRGRFPDEWPREWPDRDFTPYYTLNDEALSNSIRTMLAAWKWSDDDRYLDAAVMGGEFLIWAQMPEAQRGWAQQYNFDMEPAWARVFEPPAVSSRESAGAVRILLELYVETGDDDFLEPIPEFIDWIEDSEIAPGVWARFYELETNRPIYGDYDGRIYYDRDDIDEELAAIYGWEDSFGIARTIAFYEAVLEEGRDEFRDGWRPGDAPPAAGRIEAILDDQDVEGRWLTDGRIEIATFAANMEALAAYLRDQ